MLSSMALWAIKNYYGNSWSAAASAVTKIHTGTYSNWSSQPGEKFTYTQGWAALSRNPGVGPITAFEICAFLVSRKMLTLEEAFEGRHLPVLSNRKRINGFLKSFGWSGPFLLESSLNVQKSVDKETHKLQKLKLEKIRLQKRIVVINALLR